MEPQNEANFFKRFRIYLRQNKLKEALSDLTAALKIKPAFEGALTQRAKLQLRLGKCSEAEDDFKSLKKYGLCINNAPLLSILTVLIISNLFSPIQIIPSKQRCIHVRKCIAV
jgi:tetratricopeptide (TPR) repeat protein